MKELKVAIVQDWLYFNGGAEKVLEQIIYCFPQADIFSTIDFLKGEERKTIHYKKVTTTFIQKLPFASKLHRLYLPFMPLAIEQLDVSNYDLVISSSHAVAKGVLTHAEQIHVCYCHSPMRYAWDLYHQYLEESNLKTGLKGWFAKYFLHKIRIWDYTTANRVDYFIANSHYIAKRIKKVYGRDSVVIYPPVDTDKFSLHIDKEDFYLTASRFVPYKKIDIIAEAFAKMPNKKLIIIGDGPDFKRISSKATENVVFMGYQTSDVMVDHMQRAKAFIFAAKEDFGIIPVEAMACGTPVIAYGAGGCLETVIDGVTGVHFYDQTAEAIVEAVEKFEGKKIIFNANQISQKASDFSISSFKTKFLSFLNFK